MHRSNSAERAIRTFRKQFKEVLATTDELSPMYLWCRLLSQSCTTLDLMRNSKMNPKMSTEAQLNGAFYYNHTLLVPLGTKAIIHNNPGARGTWYIQRTKGWYIGGAPKHYQFWTICVTKTAAEHVSDTVNFFHNSSNYRIYYHNS